MFSCSLKASSKFFLSKVAPQVISQNESLSTLGYSTDAVIVIDVTIIRVEIGIVVEIIQPRSPLSRIALIALEVPSSITHHGFISVAIVIYQTGTCSI